MLNTSGQSVLEMDRVQNSESGKIHVLLATGIRISGPEQIQAIFDTAGLWIFINLGYR